MEHYGATRGGRRLLPAPLRERRVRPRVRVDDDRRRQSPARPGFRELPRPGGGARGALGEAIRAAGSCIWRGRSAAGSASGRGRSAGLIRRRGRKRRVRRDKRLAPSCTRTRAATERFLAVAYAYAGPHGPGASALRRLVSVGRSARRVGACASEDDVGAVARFFRATRSAKFPRAKKRRKRRRRRSRNVGVPDAAPFLLSSYATLGKHAVRVLREGHARQRRVPGGRTMNWRRRGRRSCCPAASQPQHPAAPASGGCPARPRARSRRWPRTCVVRSA